MSTAVATNRLRRFRLAVAKATNADRQRERLAAVIEHLGMWTTATVSVLHDGQRAVYLLVVTARPVRVQAAAGAARWLHRCSTGRRRPPPPA